MGLDRVQQLDAKFVDDLHVALEGFEHAIYDRALAGCGIDQQIGVGATFTFK